jgi:CRP-like cAMP-binding protein
MSLASDLALLRRAAPFVDLSDEQLRLVAFSGERLALSAGEALLAPSETPPGAYVVLSGALDVTAAGCRQPQSAGPGAIVAMLSLFAETDLGVGAQARRASEVMLVRRTVFRRLLEEYPEAAAALHARLSQELVRLSDEVSGVRESLDAVAAPPGEP